MDKETLISYIKEKRREEKRVSPQVMKELCAEFGGLKCLSELLVVIIVDEWKDYIKTYEYKLRGDVLQEICNDLEKENAALKEEIQRLKNDSISSNS